MVVELNPKVEEAVERTWLTSMLSAEKAKEDAIVASPLNVTKVVSVLVAMFAVIAQVLAAAGAVTLSTTQQVTIWLVAAGLIVLLSIADMTCRAYVTAKRYEYSEAVQALRRSRAEQGGPGPQSPEQPVQPKAGNRDDGKGAGVSPNGAELCQHHHAKASRNGSRLTVSMEDVFPHGCYLEPDSISEAQDCDEMTETRPVVDKRTGQQVYQCRVLDRGPGLDGLSPETVVKIVAEQMPAFPTRTRFEPVEFEGLTAIPRAIGPGQVVYSSLRATGLKRAMTPPSGQENMAS